jgi:uncharacterized protein YbjT (DUF2867 family)
MPRRVLIVGATGYIGSRLGPRLADRGHLIAALVRPESAARTPSGCRAIAGDAFDVESYSNATCGHDTLVHLIGVARPSPAKAAQFESVDLASARVAAAAAARTDIRHIVYVSVAQPAPVMDAYVAARQRAEAELRATEIPCTLLRPWYVIGPGHYWPLSLWPIYRVLELMPATREGALRLGLISLRTILDCLTHAIENPPSESRTWDVPTMRRIAAGLKQ